MEEEKKVSAVVNPISASIEELRNYLEKVESGLNWKLKFKQSKALREDRAELKLEDIIFANEFGRVKINSMGNTFEMNKFTIKNCKYKNILFDEIEKTNDHEIYLNISIYYLEVLLDLIRHFQKPKENDEKIKNITECLNYNDIDDYSEAKKVENNKKYQVDQNEEGATNEGLVQEIIDFFYDDHETILDTINIKGYKKIKNKENKGNLKSLASFKKR